MVHSKYIDKELLYWAKRKINIDMLLDSLRRHVIACTICRLKCIDPPAVTTGMLYDLGYSQYDVRVFWSRLPRGEYGFTIYQLKEGEIRILFEHNVGKVQEYYCDDVRIPVDDYDAEKRPTIYTPNSHRLFVRFHGNLGGNLIRVNVVRIAKIVESYEPGLPEELLDVIRQVYWGKRPKEDLARLIVSELSRWRNIVSLLFPHLPKDDAGYVERMPILRR
ncbi:MAG: hypothetical protein GSR72_04635 [Desulfurococcales archaeon]|nr:hypothetical protein [Desulfurococcales archaeon]MEB3789160.1 hypothetical protein [Desulfurococcales archaeon]